jgi:hypothetical protein
MRCDEEKVDSISDFETREAVPHLELRFGWKSSGTPPAESGSLHYHNLHRVYSAKKLPNIYLLNIHFIKKSRKFFRGLREDSLSFGSVPIN